MNQRFAQRVKRRGADIAVNHAQTGENERRTGFLGEMCVILDQAIVIRVRHLALRKFSGAAYALVGTQNQDTLNEGAHRHA